MTCTVEASAATCRIKFVKEAVVPAGLQNSGKLVNTIGTKEEVVGSTFPGIGYSKMTTTCPNLPHLGYIEYLGSSVLSGVTTEVKIS